MPYGSEFSYTISSADGNGEYLAVVDWGGVNATITIYKNGSSIASHSGVGAYPFFLYDISVSDTIKIVTNVYGTSAYIFKLEY